MSCKQSPFPYLCEQIKLNCLFACEVMKSYKTQRYGIKSCKTTIDVDYLQDLKYLLDFIVETDVNSLDRNTFRNKLYLEEWLKDLNGKDCLPDFKLIPIDICNSSELLEKINLL